MYRNIIFFLAILLSVVGFAQNLPSEFHFSPDGKRLVMGNNEVTGLFNESKLRVINFYFAEANYWTTLTANYAAAKDLGATVVIDGDTLATKCGVRFKGQTSYGGGGGGSASTSQKKSFNISFDFEDATQSYKGYKTLNLNNSFQDPSFMREVVYLHLSRKHTSSLKANFVQLNINGQNWGIYQCVEQINSDFIKSWFANNDGIRWRALRNDNVAGGPGGGFGTGVSSLNFLGKDTALYKSKYTLKSTGQLFPWTKLATVCDKLNNTPVAQLEDTIKNYLDLDRTLWYLATEVAFSDDDSYIWKGGMDYYLYWDAATKLLVPLEYDGNSVMKTSAQSWSPFYNETKTTLPLLNKLLANPAIRQRYLSHLRVLINSELNPIYTDALIDKYQAFINAGVLADPKKASTNTQFPTECTALKNFIKSRRNFLMSNVEVAALGTFAESLVLQNIPDENEQPIVQTKVAEPNRVAAVWLYYGTGFMGKFQKTQMFDNGSSNDGAANDGVFGAVIPAYAKGTYVRYYTEVIANDTKKTATYFPEGAEHDVFIYQVKQNIVISEVVINELMASNSTTAADQDGEFDDWIELYNNSSSEKDLSGWFMSDDATKLQKWQIPAGTKIPAKGYLIIWADENGKQAGLHASFKFSASGEACYLVQPDGAVAQEVVFAAQETDKGYARYPNGTGTFRIQKATFNANNDSAVPTRDFDAKLSFEVFPNPNQGLFTVSSNQETTDKLMVFNINGQMILTQEFIQKSEIDLRSMSAGIYFIKIGNQIKQVIVE